MAINDFTFAPNQILQPAQPSPLNRTSPAPFGASLTLTKGQSLAKKTSDGRFYPLNTGASDGTQTWAGFNGQALTTGAADSNGNVPIYGPAGSNLSNIVAATYYSTIWTGGIFDPRDVTTAAVGAPVAEVDTITPTSPTTGDTYTVEAPNGTEASFVVAGTQTAAAVVTGLTASWNANPYLKALATPSGSGTFILTGVTPGQGLNLKASAVGTGTVALVVTTAASGGAQAEKDTWTLSGTAPSIGDVFTATITMGGGQTSTITFTATVGTIANVTAGLAAAWQANAAASNYATATSTGTTFVLTGAYPGIAINVAVTTSGLATITKAVTNTAYGNTITDIQTGAPGARVLQTTGFYEIP